MTDRIDYLDFGYMNGWREYPKEYEECVSHKDHDRITTDHGCYKTDHKTVCHTCRIIWHVDSGD
jgi:hypothetical protein